MESIDVKYLKLFFYGERPVSFGGSTGRIRSGDSRMVSGLEARYFLRMYRDYVCILDTNTGDYLHVGACTPEFSREVEDNSPALVPDEGSELQSESAGDSAGDPTGDGTGESTESGPVDTESDSDGDDDSDVDGFFDELENSDSDEVDDSDGVDAPFDEFRDQVLAVVKEEAPRLKQASVEAAVAAIMAGNYSVEDLVKIKGIGKPTAARLSERFE